MLLLSFIFNDPKLLRCSVWAVCEALDEAKWFTVVQCVKQAAIDLEGAWLGAVGGKIRLGRVIPKFTPDKVCLRL